MESEARHYEADVKIPYSEPGMLSAKGVMTFINKQNYEQPWTHCHVKGIDDVTFTNNIVPRIMEPDLPWHNETISIEKLLFGKRLGDLAWHVEVGIGRGKERQQCIANPRSSQKHNGDLQRSLTANGGLTGFLMFEFEKVHPTPALHNEVRYGLRQLHKNGKVHGNLQKRHVLVNVKKPYPNMVIEVRFLSFSQVEDAKAASEEKGEADLKRCVLGDDPAPNIIPPAASSSSFTQPSRSLPKVPDTSCQLAPKAAKKRKLDEPEANGDASEEPATSAAVVTAVAEGPVTITPLQQFIEAVRRMAGKGWSFADVKEVLEEQMLN